MLRAALARQCRSCPDARQYRTRNGHRVIVTKIVLPGTIIMMIMISFCDIIITVSDIMIMIMIFLYDIPPLLFLRLRKFVSSPSAAIPSLHSSHHIVYNVRSSNKSGFVKSTHRVDSIPCMYWSVVLSTSSTMSTVAYEDGARE